MSGAPKRILFLDDDHRRIAAFRAIVTEVECELAVVETADECIARLADGAWDLVLLDHDLGGEIYCDSAREDCGMEVVRWLSEHGGDHGGFIVHTHNEIAGAAMYLALEGMGYPVTQGMFGSSAFHRALASHLGIRRTERRRRRTLSERVRDYFRSLRLGR
ncbi:MAG TPA: cyclic-phosphate processing receiver domain-containing protein [Candidatus Kapabacteria bacterium]|jgi:CheY-like chemotaxis protein|nr:cyclic-phosphate processing receiver domain-containing protein [Candidatus Kapabacteria bacterium]